MASEESRSVAMMQKVAAKTLTGTPGLNDRSTVDVRPGGTDKEKERVIVELQRQIDEQKARNQTMEVEFKGRVGQYAQTESVAKTTLDALEKQFHAVPQLDEDFRRKLDGIRTHQDSIVGLLDRIQLKTADLLQEQEKELMRAFRTRLTDLTKELEAQQSKKGDYSAELQARHRRVQSELDLSQELAQDFDRKNQKLQQENQRLVEKLRTRDDDRQCLMRELVSSKREAARLKQQSESKQEEQSQQAEEGPKHSGYSQKQVEQARHQIPRNRAFEQQIQAREALKQIKRQEQRERLQGSILQQRQQQALDEQSPLAVLLRKCVDDVKQDVARRRGPQLTHGVLPNMEVSVHEFTQLDREAVMEALLSEPEAIRLLYDQSLNQGSDDDEKLSWMKDVFPRQHKPGMGASGSLRGLK